MTEPPHTSDENHALGILVEAGLLPRGQRAARAGRLIPGEDRTRRPAARTSHPRSGRRPAARPHRRTRPTRRDPVSVEKITVLRCDNPGCRGTFHGLPSVAGSATRRAARAEGWRHESGHPSTPEAGGDFCPDHTPNGASR